ncbi:hypothetical protein HMPREF9370_0432 [Neisseria wadsworthii 9715]|uniref:Uncharacterized protein n=1 Tax=Neisseria wadsworthii 9715 TaxID=1030841 RepID=G4CMX3_9NEIS|nr:hypothetical protein HMPREF9370_0432 [Neisseria wadsworthii 9715]
MLPLLSWARVCFRRPKMSRWNSVILSGVLSLRPSESSEVLVSPTGY